MFSSCHFSRQFLIQRAWSCPYASGAAARVGVEPGSNHSLHFNPQPRGLWSSNRSLRQSAAWNPRHKQPVLDADSAPNGQQSNLKFLLEPPKG